MQTYALVLAAVMAAAGLLPTAAAAMVGAGARPIEMAARSPAYQVDHVGCYRLGLSGYRWYRSCIGPRFMYPHHRICHRHHCYYR
jgi:hypothetical protein